MMLKDIKPERVFKYFEEIASVPRGSGDMQKIADYCQRFAEKIGLNWVRDEANNVVIYKDASKGYEQSEPVILQGHLDMVCQKEEGLDFDFEKDGIKLFVDGDYIKARGTTLGADNGIAVAMIMAILEDNNLSHPPIEALFTTDEEIGMIGAEKLSADLLKGRRMINLDSEEMGVITVSCAGGSDFEMTLPVKREKVNAQKVSISLYGLKGGHSGVEINAGRVNANILAGRICAFAEKSAYAQIIDVAGGDKGNAIPCACKINLAVESADELILAIESYLKKIKEEISDREPDFAWDIISYGEGEYEVLDKIAADKLVFILNCVLNGVIEMSATIENLVETSLNLGVLKTGKEEITMLLTLRSNKQSSLEFLEQRLTVFAKGLELKVATSGHYPPWEFKNDSKLQELCKKTYEEMFSCQPIIAAIHAGLECATLSAKIEGLDCISIGPDLKDVHTVNEKLSISSTETVYKFVKNLLKNMK